MSVQKQSTRSIPTGYKRTEVGVIPEDWEVKSLGDIGQSLIGLTYRPSDIKESGTLVLRSSNVQNDRLSFEDNVYVDARIPDRIRVRNEDILICVRNGSRELIGKCALLDERVVGQTFGAFMAVLRTAYPRYVFQQFRSHNIQSQIHKHLGATINQITNRSLNSFDIPFPLSASERVNIETALFDIDALITDLEKLIAKKRAIKQGAMQELLTGKRRLAGFSAKWQTKRLGDVADIRTGKKDVNEGNPRGQYPFFTCSRDISYSDSYSFDGEAILIAGNGDVGNLHYYNGKFEAYQRTYVLQYFEINTQYLWYQLTANLKRSLGIGTIGTSIPYIKRENLSDLILEVPRLEEEQVAITRLLQDVDQELLLLHRQTTKLRHLKLGMMQSLLTGRIRLMSQ